MSPKSQTAICFVLNIIGSLHIVSCAGSRNRFNTNLPGKTVPLNLASVIADLWVEPLIVHQLPNTNGYNYHAQLRNQYEVGITMNSDQFHYQTTPKLKLKRAIEFDDSSTKVLDGVVAEMGEFQFLASLKRQNGQHFCGGTILDAYHILTAAHCFRDATGLELDLNPEEYSVTVGEYDLKRKDRYEQNLRVDHICVHRNYINVNPSVFGSDIALIRLRERVQFFRGVVERARLPPRGGEVVDIRRGTADAVGWGYTADANGTLLRSNVLHTTYLKLYKARECSGFRGVRSSLICAGDDIDDNSVRARNTCAGDSGGPVICSGVVCGVVSHGLNCNTNFDSTRVRLTRVHYFRNWINRYILNEQDNQCRPIE